jgi:perosamine synthetase
MAKDLWRVGADELGYIERAISNGLTGEMTEIFEARFAEKIGTEYAIAVNSGTSALHAAMAALEIGPGDEVIVPPLTFIATAFAPLFVGAVPVFADVDSCTFNIDPEDVERKITKRTKAIITVSLYGLPPDMGSIMAIAEKHGLKVVEDNAQCVMGKYGGKIAGTIGDISIFSLQRSKHLTAGDGGVAVTSDEDIAVRIRKLADLGYATLTAKPLSNENFKETIQHPDFKRHQYLGYNFRMPEVCAAMGLAQLDKLDALLEKRIAIGRIYDEAVQGCDWLIPQYTPEGITHSYWAYVVKIVRADISWSTFRQTFRANGGDRFYGAWSLSYLEPALEGMEFPDHGIRYERGLCPTAESLQPNLVQFKTNFEDLQYARGQAEALAKTIAQLA